MIGESGVRLLTKLINDRTLPGIMALMPPGDWKQWTQERPQWIHENMEKAFWRFVDQKWRDSLNMAAAEPAFTDYGFY